MENQLLLTQHMTKSFTFAHHLRSRCRNRQGKAEITQGVAGKSAQTLTAKVKWFKSVKLLKDYMMSPPCPAVLQVTSIPTQSRRHRVSQIRWEEPFMEGFVTVLVASPLSVNHLETYVQCKPGFLCTHWTEKWDKQDESSSVVGWLTTHGPLMVRKVGFHLT